MNINECRVEASESFERAASGQTRDCGQRAPKKRATDGWRMEGVLSHQAATQQVMKLIMGTCIGPAAFSKPHFGRWR